MQTKQQGAFAEQLACHFLTKQGLQLRSKNFLRRIGEIDLIMLEPESDTTVLIEVRYRALSCHGGPIESIDRIKQRKLRNTAKLVQQCLPNSNAKLRLDVVGISPQKQANKTQALQLNICDIEYHTFQQHHITWIKNAITE